MEFYSLRPLRFLCVLCDLKILGRKERKGSGSLPDIMNVQQLLGKRPIIHHIDT